MLIVNSLTAATAEREGEKRDQGMLFRSGGEKRGALGTGRMYTHTQEQPSYSMGQGKKRASNVQLKREGDAQTKTNTFAVGQVNLQKEKGVCRAPAR